MAHRTAARAPPGARAGSAVEGEAGWAPPYGEIMISPARLRRVASAHPYLFDSALAGLVGGVGVLPLLLGLHPNGSQPSNADGVAAVIAFLLLLARRRAPLAVLALLMLS